MRDLTYTEVYIYLDLWKKTLVPFLKADYRLDVFGGAIYLHRQESMIGWIIARVERNTFRCGMHLWTIKDRGDFERIPKSLLLLLIEFLRSAGFAKSTLELLLSEEDL